MRSGGPGGGPTAAGVAALEEAGREGVEVHAEEAGGDAEGEEAYLLSN